MTSTVILLSGLSLFLTYTVPLCRHRDSHFVTELTDILLVVDIYPQLVVVADIQATATTWPTVVL
jgi:hypothetical protein